MFRCLLKLLKSQEKPELKAVDGSERQATWHAVVRLVPSPSRQQLQKLKVRWCSSLVRGSGHKGWRRACDQDSSRVIGSRL